MKTASGTYPLRPPPAIKAEAERLAASEGVSFNQFAAAAIPEKVSALRTADHFAARKGKIDWNAFDRVRTERAGSAATRRRDAGITGATYRRRKFSLPSLRPKQASNIERRVGIEPDH
jgi:hypothetical protein